MPPLVFISSILLAGILSYLYFKSQISKQTNATKKITRPTIIPTVTVFSNPFAPTSAAFNPFASPSATVENPFGSYQNPFSAQTTAAESQNQPYKNPFEQTKP